MAASSSKEHVLLLHGLWMRGFSMSRLAAHFRIADFECEALDYASLTADPLEACDAIADHLRSIDADRVHIVAHSLGGLVALETLRQFSDLPDGRLVCLGSPLNGSAAARGLDKIPGGNWFAGRAQPLLCEGVKAWDGAREVGVIAGRMPVGLGVLFAGFESEHDGTVAVSETQLDGISDHIILPATHSGLLFSDQVSKQCVEFLRHGKFLAN